jgi:DNA-binding ferritin-like protein (Dps family)
VPKSLNDADSIIDGETNCDVSIDARAMQKIIDKHLPSEYRADYLKIISDVYVPKKTRNNIIEKIKELLEEHGYEER